MDFETKNVRNAAISGHGQTGKTTLFEHLMFVGKAIAQTADVESGKTVSDNSPEEISRKISIYTTLSHLTWNNKILNIWDTPGSSDFVGEVISAFRSCEYALMLVDSRSGAQIETVKLWRDLDRRNKPRMVFMNRVDDDRGNVAAANKDIHDKFNVEITPITIPVGNGSAYKGVIDVLKGKMYKKPAPGEIEKAEEIPADYMEMYKNARDVIAGSAAEGDDDLLVKFIDEGQLSDEEISLGLKSAFAANKIVPVFAGDPINNSGLVSLLDFMADIAPSPLERLETAVTAENGTASVKILPDKPFSALVVKTAGDQFSGKLSYIKVLSGSLTPDVEVNNITRHKKEKIGKIYRCIGKKLEEVKAVAAGDICIASKLAATETSDTLAADPEAMCFKPLRHPDPVYSIAVAAADKKAEDKMSTQLSKAAETDRTLTFQYNAETRQNVLSGMGELQLSIILERIKADTGITVETSIPRIAYRETVQKKAEAEYTHKKQSGGHGQYARVVLSVQPLKRGEEYKFTNAVFGGAIPKNYIPGVEKGVKQAMEHGVLAGYPVTDIDVTVLDGKDHPVDSSDLAFQLAARNALSDAMVKASPILLEPILNLSVWVDTKYVGDIMSDLSSRRGRILGQNTIGSGIEEIKAQVPHAELLRYAIDLRAITSATGSFETSFDHYDPISGKTADNVIAEAKAFNAKLSEEKE
ncbi:elongation factor G [Treponema parvum]|uniref:Elongation factor G n=1 Tax=Treponema parvum TaxID=138851 RepID=A0A975IEI8_9SPIR|nr:elongation factor G [Treponema parvum]QTQ13948.1 elongation factor G [Treponema parvum]